MYKRNKLFILQKLHNVRGANPNFKTLKDKNKIIANSKGVNYNLVLILQGLCTKLNSMC